MVATKPLVFIEHLKCDWYNWGTKSLILFNLTNLNLFIYLFYKFIYLFIFGCIGSLLLRTGCL